MWPSLTAALVRVPPATTLLQRTPELDWGQSTFSVVDPVCLSQSEISQNLNRYLRVLVTQEVPIIQSRH